jgi:hypothetical protein
MECGHTSSAYYDGCMMCQELEDLRESVKAKDEAIDLFLHHWKHGGISRNGFFVQQTAHLMLRAASLRITPAAQEEK